MFAGLIFGLTFVRAPKLLPSLTKEIAAGSGWKPLSLTHPFQEAIK
jgi:hypothetical protein